MRGSDGPVPFRGRRRGPATTSRWLVVLLLVALVGATWVLFVRPASDDPAAVADGPPLDAVLVLGGGDLERVTTGVALARSAARPDDGTTVLLLSVPYGPPFVTCGQDPAAPAVEVRCVTPVPFTTSGEGRTLLGSAADAGWGRVAVVTSTYHLSRARVLVERCRERLGPNVEVVYVDAGADLGSLRGAWLVAQEWLSLLATPFDEPCST